MLMLEKCYNLLKRGDDKTMRIIEADPCISGATKRIKIQSVHASAEET